jgi:hypothetical protein
MMLSFGVVTARITRDLPTVKLQKIVYTTLVGNNNIVLSLTIKIDHTGKWEITSD